MRSLFLLNQNIPYLKRVETHRKTSLELYSIVSFYTIALIAVGAILQGSPTISHATHIDPKVGTTLIDIALVGYAVGSIIIAAMFYIAKKLEKENRAQQEKGIELSHIKDWESTRKRQEEQRRALVKLDISQ